MFYGSFKKYSNKYPDAENFINSILSSICTWHMGNSWQPSHLDIVTTDI